MNSSQGDVSIRIEKAINGNILVLNNLNLESLPKSIKKLTNVKTLLLNNNRFSEIPEEIFSLPSLQYLELSNNNIAQIPDGIGKLKNLESLSLWGNQISTLPKTISKLQNLQHLFINKNKLIEIPPELFTLTNLRSLDLSSNLLETIPPNIDALFKLETLDLSENRITRFPREIAKLTKLNFIGLKHNNLDIPPIEIIHQGSKPILNYLKSISESSELVQIFEAKLLIVGEGGVGKTFLVNRLVFDLVKEDETTTEGIEINSWYIDTSLSKHFRVNCWDFGGQEIYHATHQFFLTKRSLYLFLWEARKDDNLISFDYWLNVIKLLGDNPPVLVIQNKIDERIRMIDEKSINKKFENIIAFHKVSALKNIGISELVNDIKKNIIALDHIGDTLPKSWIEIRKELEIIHENYISYREYLDICRKYGLDDERANFLSRYYHDLGVFLHFPDNLILRNILILKPEWATNAVYKIVDTRAVQINLGKFNYQELLHIWDDYPEDKYVHILELMKRFELCFQLSGTQDYIIPELLPPQQPEIEWEYENNLRFEYHYDFMPAGIITRFIVRNYRIIQNNIYWKYGAILEREDTKALIISEPLNRKIRIWIEGNDKKSLLALIRVEIEAIHETLNAPNVLEMIPCVCSECKNDPNPEFHNYQSIRKAVAKGKKSLECRKSFNNVYIENLLGEIGDEGQLTEPKYVIHASEVTIHDGENSMKIENVNIKNSHVNFADRIDKIEYQNNLEMSQSDFDEIKQAIKKLSEDDRNALIAQSTLSEATIEQKAAAGNRIKAFLTVHGVAVVQNLTASAIFEAIRYLLF